MNSIPGYSRNSNFIKALNSFWVRVWEDREVSTQFIKGYGESFSEAYFNFLQGILGVSIKNVPVFNRKKWHFLSLKGSESLGDRALTYTSESNRITYGPQPEDSIYQEGLEFNYGNTDGIRVYSWKLPANFKDVDRFIFNRIHDASLCLVKGEDFVIVGNTITFTSNPFDNPLVPKRNILDLNGSISDREIGLWCLNSYWDYELVYQNYGTLFKVYRPSSEQYKAFIQAIWKMYVGGPSYSNIEAGINAILGLPISQDSEIIENISSVNSTFSIQTNLRSYTLPVGVTPASKFYADSGGLKPGYQLRPFEALTDAVSIKDRKSSPNWWRDVDPLILPRNLFVGEKDFFLPSNVNVYIDSIIGRESGLPLEYSVPSEDLRFVGTRVGAFEIGGTAADPKSTLVNYKDYIMETYFSNNVFFLAIDTTGLGDVFDGTVSKIILESLPAYVFFINYTFLEVLTEEYTLDDTTGDVTYSSSTETCFDNVVRVIGQTSTEIEAFDVGVGQEFTEECTESDSSAYDSSLNLGYTDGYYGAPIVGFVTIGGFSLGRIGFNNGLLVTSRC